MSLEEFFLRIRFIKILRKFINDPVTLNHTWSLKTSKLK